MGTSNQIFCGRLCRRIWCSFKSLILLRPWNQEFLVKKYEAELPFVSTLLSELKTNPTSAKNGAASSLKTGSNNS